MICKIFIRAILRKQQTHSTLIPSLNQRIKFNPNRMMVSFSFLQGKKYVGRLPAVTLHDRTLVGPSTSFFLVVFLYFMPLPLPPAFFEIESVASRDEPRLFPQFSTRLMESKLKMAYSLACTLPSTGGEETLILFSCHTFSLSPCSG